MDLRYEKRLNKKGYKRVVGLDEAGRGPLAGPVCAGAVLVSGRISRSLLNKVKDSKKMTPRAREQAYELLIRNANIKWAVACVSEKVIDRVNILEATKIAMKRAAKKLNPDFLILDGNFKINTAVLQESIIKADTKIFSCAAGSIISKVFRDRKMRRYHQQYPDYGFDRHKGYPTPLHYIMLKKHGPSRIHRKTFRLR